MIEVELEASPFDWLIAAGCKVQGYAFNGQVPGPVIQGRVGDTLVVRFRNKLPEPTTIHWHGLRVPSHMDGTDMVQNPVRPGESFEYRFVLPDAGTFWYHPHLNEAEQLEKGLYGAIVVRGPQEPVLDGEQLLLLDDIELAEQGRPAGPRNRTCLLNGQAEARLGLRAGQTERWRIVNVASSLYVLLSIGGRPFQVLATDGGLLPAPVRMDQVLLAPADRVELAVGPFREGESFGVESLPYDGGMMKEKGGRFATLTVGPSAPSHASIPASLRRIEPLASRESPPTRTVLLSGRRNPQRGVDWLINRESHHRDRPVQVGELQVWDIVNESRMDHPFHLHGFFFQVLEVNGEEPPFLSWEDTVNVPASGRVRIAWLPDDRPGEWMYHCHILQHHAAGMMAHFQVVSPGSTGDAGATHHAHHGPRA